MKHPRSEVLTAFCMLIKSCANTLIRQLVSENVKEIYLHSLMVNQSCGNNNKKQNKKKRLSPSTYVVSK